jgi:mRNA-degrading endonuclease RelE of RelBE toxin-antitoxin system
VAQPFEIEFTQSALDDLRYLRRTDQTRILDSVDRHLSSEPASPARNRKALRPNSLAAWELRIGKLRAFYDVDVLRKVVLIKVVGWKEHNQLFVRGKSFFSLNSKTSTKR